jgi:SPP1 family predicted phage head-tail adaptor
MLKPRDKNPLALDAGALRYQVSIQVQSSTQDEMGGPVAAWTPVLKTWAAIATSSQREVYQSGAGAQFVAQVTHRVQIRWPGAVLGIAGGMRVAFGDRLFQIQTVENVQERNRVLNLLCLEINGVS